MYVKMLNIKLIKMILNIDKQEVIKFKFNLFK